MRCRAALGRLSAPVEVRASDRTGLEMFVAPRIAEGMPLLDAHHGRPLAHLRSTSVLPDGTLLGEFLVRRGREAEVRALEGRPLSIEFARGSRDLEDRGPGGRYVMVHRGAEVVAVAALGHDEEPARGDCRMEWVEQPAQEPLAVRSRPSQDADLMAELQRRHPRAANGNWTHRNRGGSIIRYG